MHTQLLVVIVVSDYTVMKFLMNLTFTNNSILKHSSFQEILSTPNSNRLAGGSAKPTNLLDKNFHCIYSEKYLGIIT